VRAVGRAVDRTSRRTFVRTCRRPRAPQAVALARTFEGTLHPSTSSTSVLRPGASA
jgi:hypothetical protein